MSKYKRPPGFVYLLCLSQPLNATHPKRPRHYLGYTKGSLLTRYLLHLAGQGARFTQVAVQRGITFTVTRAWRGGRDFERRLKHWHNGPALCPHCGRAIGRFTNELSEEELRLALLTN